MDILTLFCEIDDFFLDYERWIAPQCLPEAVAMETRGAPETAASERSHDAPDRFPSKWVSDL